MCFHVYAERMTITPASTHNPSIATQRTPSNSAAPSCPSNTTALSRTRMPLQPAYTWTETDSSIQITVDNVPIKDQGQLFCADRVVKLNCPPYLLLLDLLHPVDDDRSSATIIKGRKVVIKLQKAEPGAWHRLTPTPAERDPQQLKRQREESVQRAHRKLVAAQQQRQARKQQEERAAVDLQIQQQKAQRDQLEALKQQELQQERQELQDWQQQLPAQGDEDDDLAAGDPAAAGTAADAGAHADKGGGDSSNSSSTASMQEVYHGKGWWPSKSADDHSQQPDTPCSPISGSTSSKGDAQEMITLSSSGGSSKGTHTSSCSVRELTTPDAPTTLPGCRSLLLNDAAAAAAAADQTTEQPFLSATSSRRLGPAAASAKHIATASSLTTATTTSSSASASQRPMKPVAPVRSRGVPVQVSFTQLETPHLPARQQREVEIKQIKRAAGQQADSMNVADRQPAFLKDKGDAFAAQGNYRGAINAYSKALELDPSQAALWANRAAAHLALGAAAECVQDCTAAIGLVEKAQTALQEAPGAAAEQELRAGMLGAVAAPAAAAEPAAQPAAATETARPAAAVGAPAAAADATATEYGEDNSGVQSAAADETACAAACGSDSTTTTTQAAAEQQQPQQTDSVAQQLKQLLVKLFARRAAANVELQQLPEAAEDLQHALRLDPSNLMLQADALEVSLALSPGGSTEPSAVKELAAARFKAGDLQGAAAVFTSLVELLEQQQHLQEEVEESGNSDDDQQHLQEEGSDTSANRQQQLAGALSNRAACWLGLNRFEDCVADCLAAFRVLLFVCETSRNNNNNNNNQSGQSASNITSSSIAALGEDAVQLLQTHPPQFLLLQDSGNNSRAAAQSAARIVSRMAAACACAKAAVPADAAFEWAAECWGLLGEQGRVEAMRADQQKLRVGGRSGVSRGGAGSP